MRRETRRRGGETINETVGRPDRARMRRDPETGRHDPNARLFATKPRGTSRRAAHTSRSPARRCPRSTSVGGSREEGRMNLSAEHLPGR